MSAPGQRDRSVDAEPSPHRIALVLAGLVGLLAVLAIVGWVTGLTALTRLGPNLASVRFNTAAAVLLLALTWFVPRRVALAGLGLAAAIGIASIVEHASGANLHVDRLFVQSGRISIMTSSSLIVLSIVLAVGTGGPSRVRSRAAVVGAEAVLVVAAFELFGYLYGARSLYAVGAFASVSLHAAIALSLLSLAIMIEAPNSALWWILRGRDVGAAIMRKVIPAVLVSVPLVGYLRLRGEVRGWFDARFSLALMVTVVILILTIVVGVAARSLVTVDRERAAVLTELRQLTGELDQRVQRRTAELEREREALVAAEAAARTAQAAAEKASAAKDEFLSRMSHELRTPLNAVLGFAQLLDLDPLEPAQASAVGHILSGGKHLLAMINDLLDITSIAANQLELSLEPVPVTALLTETVGLLQPLAASAGVTLTVAADPVHGSVTMLADRRRLKQVLLNVVGNAIKYNRPGGRVDIAVVPHAAGTVDVSVADTGVGIPAADLPRLFNLFDRLGRESSEVEGSGIGLALSHRLLVAMGGNLDVDSVAGEGSTFTIVLPAGGGAAGDPDGPPAGEPRPVPLATLLYIEDSQPSVELLAAVLARRPDWTLLHAASAAEGIEAATTARPAAVIVELHLPDGDAADVVLRLRGHPDTDDVPSAVVSAGATPRQIRGLLAAGANRHLSKPIRVEEVFGFLDGLAR